MSWKDYFVSKPAQPTLETFPDWATNNMLTQPTEDHTHQFETKMVTYAPPRRDVQGIQLDPNSELAQAMFLGLTTILSECLVCHRLRKEAMLGSQNTQLDDLLDKTEAYGPQYMQRENTTFAISKYQAPAPSLPIR